MLPANKTLWAGGVMTDKSHLLEPAIIIVDSDSVFAAYINEIVFSVLGLSATIFKYKIQAHDWCTAHPVHVDMVIAWEGDSRFNGFKLFKEPDGIFLRPVLAVLLLNPSENEASAAAWFCGLDKAFKTMIPFKAIRYPYRLSKLGTVLNDAFSWYKPEMRCSKIIDNNK
jgi:hypothetical protein